MPDGDNAAGNAKGNLGSAWSFFRNMDFKTDALKIFRNIQKIWRSRAVKVSAVGILLKEKL